VRGLGFVFVLGVVSIQDFVLVFFRRVGERSTSEPPAELCVVSDDGRLHPWAGEVTAPLSPRGDTLGIAVFHDPLLPGTREIYVSAVVVDEEPAADDSVAVDSEGLMVSLP